jgi:hypothetical protein
MSAARDILVNERVITLIRKTSHWIDQPEPHGSKAAFLEFLAAAARTRVVSSDALEGILKALAAVAIGLRLPPPPLLVSPVLLGEAVPSG